MPRLVPVLQADARRQPGDVRQDDGAGMRPFRDPAVERVHQGERRARLHPVEAAEQRLDLRHHRLHQDRRANGRPQPLDNAGQPVERAIDPGARILRRGGGPVEAKHPRVADDQRHVQPGRMQRAARVGRLLQGAVVGAFEDLDRHPVAQRRTGDRRTQQGQRPVAQDAQLDRAQARRGLGRSGGRHARDLVQLALIQRRCRQRDGSSGEVFPRAGRNVSLQALKLLAKVSSGRRQPWQVAQHTKTLSGARRYFNQFSFE